MLWQTATSIWVIAECWCLLSPKTSPTCKEKLCIHGLHTCQEQQGHKALAWSKGLLALMLLPTCVGWRKSLVLWGSFYWKGRKPNINSPKHGLQKQVHPFRIG